MPHIKRAELGMASFSPPSITGSAPHCRPPDLAEYPQHLQQRQGRVALQPAVHQVPEAASLQHPADTRRNG